MNILYYENYGKNLNLKNEIQNHLSQYPYISYSIKDNEETIILTFNKDVNHKYGLGLLNIFTTEVLENEPLKVKITGKKNIDKFEEFKGKPIINTVEKVDFPELGIKALASKIDSGATTSSIYASKIKKDLKLKKVSFILLDPSYPAYTGKIISKPIHSQIRVQSSNGEESSRVLIKTKIIIKGKEIETFISLADRKDLQFPVLIGKDVSNLFLIQSGL